MPEISIEIEVWCADCGKGLCGISGARRGKQGLDVGLCPDCKERAFQEGYDKGQAEAVSRVKGGKE